MADEHGSRRASEMPRIEKLPAYIQVADQIRRAIQLGQYVCDDRLPTEIELAEQIGVSRTTLREALRQLEGEGYLKARPGARGGLFVIQRDDAAESQLGYLRANWDDIEHFFDYRIAVECAGATLAARTRSADDLEAMARANRALAAGQSHSESRAADSAFHLAVVRATGNPYLCRAVEDARAGMFRPLDVFGFSHATWSDQPDKHRAILDAIEARDAKTAERAMRAHIGDARRRIREMIWRGRDPGGRDAPAADAAAPGKAGRRGE